jgi:glyoxylase-like metal-dependent hydrolase (beta-lactamase superfamily II)
VVELKNRCGGTILTHRIESENLNNPAVTLNYYIGIPDIELEENSRVDDNDLIHLGNIEFRVILTPGHTNGSTSLFCEKEKMLFSGDTLFRGTWGRTDLPTSSLNDIMDSIINKLLVLPEDTIVYPGHGKSTMIKEEKPIYLELRQRDL